MSCTGDMQVKNKGLTVEQIKDRIRDIDIRHWFSYEVRYRPRNSWMSPAVLELLEIIRTTILSEPIEDVKVFRSFIGEYNERQHRGYSKTAYLTAADFLLYCLRLSTGVK